MAEFDQQTRHLLEWFKEQKGAKFNSNLQFEDLRAQGRGRGIVAKVDIPEDTELFVIPRTAILGTENSEVVKKLPDVFQQTLVDDVESEAEENGIALGDPWLELITVLIYEYLHSETSPWRPYLDVLPEEFDSLMYWEPAELKTLQASAICDKIGREEAEETFHKKLLPLIHEHRNIFYPSGAKPLTDEELLKLCFRMGSIIMAYAFDLDKEISDDEQSDDEDMNGDGWMRDLVGLGALGMVPMADMLNADADFNVSLIRIDMHLELTKKAHLNHEENALRMTSTRPIKAGEEVLNYYGPLPNGDLLRRYGYTTEKHATFDVVEVAWDLVREAMRDKLGKEAEANLPDELDDTFVLEREIDAADDGPDEVNGWPCSSFFGEFPDEVEEEVSTVIASVVGIDIENVEEELAGADQNKIRGKFLELMHQVLSARLKQYETTIVEDKALVPKQEKGSRVRDAIVVRLGEKLLLQEALDFTSKEIGSLQDEHAQEDGEEHSKKKQKTTA